MIVLQSSRVVVASLLSVVFLTAAQMNAQPTWSVQRDPQLRLRNGATEQTTFTVIVGAVRLDSSHVVVADNRNGELRLFDTDGMFQKRITRQGEGPNELGNISWLRSTSEGLIAYDYSRTVWYRKPDLSEQRRSAGSGLAGIRAFGAFGNGVMFGFRAQALRAIEQIEESAQRSSIEFVVYHADGNERVFSLGSRLGFTDLTILSNTARAPFRAGRLSFGHHLWTAPATTVLWFADSGTGWLGRMHSVSGAIDSLPIPLPPQRWDEAAISRGKSRVLRTVADPADRELPLAQLERRFRPSTPPRIAGLFADIGDGVWLEVFRQDPAELRWFLVLNKNGRVLARVTLPSALRVMEIGEDYVLGTESDADGLQDVVMSRLDRSAS